MLCIKIWECEIEREISLVILLRLPAKDNSTFPSLATVKKFISLRSLVDRKGMGNDDLHMINSSRGRKSKIGPTSG